jgi:hypothetical protein
MATKKTPTKTKQFEQAQQAIAEVKSKSKQPRFDDKSMDGFFMSTMRWEKEAFEVLPDYASNSRTRSTWLNQFWKNEPYLSGVINSVVQIDRNRGWSLVGGRNQVLRFTDVLHNWQVQPGRASWREGCGAMAQSFYTQDIGGLAEVGRMFDGGPMTGMYHLDPSRCVLTSSYEYPMRYYPPRATVDGSRMVELAPTDYLRTVSQINIDETFNGLGYCALSRAIELAITMVAVWRHEQEMLFARAPKGLLLLKGISQATWNNAMAVRDATLDSQMRQWYGAVAVLASSGMDDVDAKLVALSQLPTNFDQKTFTDLLMYGYALCFGYDAREFWPVSSGSMGTATETQTQHRKATSKGEKEFPLALQEELQGNLPPTLHFEVDERSVDGEMAEALLQKEQVAAIYAMTDLSPEQKMTLLAEAGIIPTEWAVGGADSEATDTEDADSPENSNDEKPAPSDVAAQMLQYPEVQRAIHDYPDDPLCVYRWNGRTGRIVELPVRNPRRTVHPVAVIMQRLAAQVEAELPPPAPRVIVREIPAPAPAEEKPTMRDWFALQFQTLADKIKPVEPMQLTIHNHPSDPTPVIVENTNVMPDQTAPAVNVLVNPTPVTVQNAIPEGKTPVVNVAVSPTPVTVKNTVNVPKQPAPVVNVQTDTQARDRAEFLKSVRKLNAK